MKSELLWMLPRREESDACLLDVNCEILVLKAELRELFLLNLSEVSRPSSELKKVVVPSFLTGLISEASALASVVKLLPPFLDCLKCHDQDEDDVPDTDLLPGDSWRLWVLDLCLMLYRSDEATAALNSA